MVNVDMTLDFPTILSAHERIQPHIHLYARADEFATGRGQRSLAIL